MQIHWQWSFRCLAVFVTILGAALACNFSSTQKPDAARQALEEAVALTITAAAAKEDSGRDLATAQAEATQIGQEIAATQTAMAAAHDESQLATATVIAPILAELPRYHVDTSQGRVAWIHKPVKLELRGKNQYGYANDYMQTVVRDFVLAADITWDTQYGTSGCGFMFRSNGDQKKPNQYMLIATRFASGHVLFTAMADGQLANVRDFFPKSEDPKFSAENGATNRLAVVARGNILEVYMNGSKIGEIDTTQPPPQPRLPPPPKLPTNANLPSELEQYKQLLNEREELLSQMKDNYSIALGNFKAAQAVFEEGFVAMIAVSESGHTICEFDNAWLWIIE